MLAAFAKVNNQLRPEDEKALRRLVMAVVEGIDDPQLYQVLTGEVQEMEGIVTGWSLAWTQPWEFYFDEDFTFQETLAIKKFKSTRLGGDLAWLFRNDASAQNRSSDHFQNSPKPPVVARD
jgi:hypothetical protein